MPEEVKSSEYNETQRLIKHPLSLKFPQHSKYSDMRG